MARRHSVSKRILLSIVLLAVLLYGALLVALWAGQETLLFMRREAALEKTPADLGWAFEEVVLPVSGETTHGWWMPLPDAHGAILYAHGSGRNISHYLDDAEIFRGLGFSVLMYDYGGYGRSTGEPSEARCCADARAMWDHLTGALGMPPERVVLAGSSMGGGITADLAAQVKPAAVILECTFTSIADVVADTYPWIPARLLVHIGFNNYEKITRFSAPVIILHSPDDTVVPYAQAQRLYERAVTPKTFVTLHGSHAGAKFDSRDTYVSALRGFLAQYVQ